MLTSWCVAVAMVVGAPPDEDEQAVAAAGHKSDGPGLIAFLKALTPTAAGRGRVARLIRQLGADAFASREEATRSLIAAGPLALPALQAAATDPDLEIARRAQQCIAQIEITPHLERRSALLRLLARHRPPGAAEALLDYLAGVEGENPSEETLAALAALGLQESAPIGTIRQALADRTPARRAAAAWVIGKAAVEHGKLLVPLLRDPSAAVRFHSASALVVQGNKQAVPVLIALLETGSLDQAGRAEELLLAAAGAAAPTTYLEPDPARRTAAATAWREWWRVHGDKLDLAKVPFADAPLGWTIVAEWENHGKGPGHVRAFAADGKERWHLDGLDSPHDFQQLPGGRLLIAEFWLNRVTERDRTGKVLREIKLPSYPVSCQRLPNGNTFVATYERMTETSPAGKEVYSIAADGGWIYSAEKLPDGHVVCVNLQGQVTEYDRNRMVLRRFTPAAHAAGAAAQASVERLPGGKYLIALAGANRVVETDGTGKILWEATVTDAGWATRLRNGNTLVCSTSGKFVVEVNSAGKEVSKIPMKFRTFRARRR